MFVGCKKFLIFAIEIKNMKIMKNLSLAWWWRCSGLKKS